MAAWKCVFLHDGRCEEHLKFVKAMVIPFFPLPALSLLLQGEFVGLPLGAVDKFVRVHRDLEGIELDVLSKDPRYLNALVILTRSYAFSSVMTGRPLGPSRTRTTKFQSLCLGRCNASTLETKGSMQKLKD